MAAFALRNEERIGLALAIAAHGGLVAWLALNPPRAAPLAPPERMTVTLSDDVALTSTAPQPQAEPARDAAPQSGETAAEPAPPAPVAAPVPPPVQPRPVSVQPAPTRPAPPRPVAIKPPPTKVQPAPVRPAAAKPTAATPTVAKPATTKPPAAKPAGASRIGADFLKGMAGGTASGKAQTPPAAVIGPAVKSALAGAISRQLKPRWIAPQGAEADRLITWLSWDLAADGSLVGSPRVVRQDGITAANRAQAARHAEQAVRAVRLAAPFQLPGEFYPAWKHVSEFRFDRKLSQ